MLLLSISGLITSYDPGSISEVLCALVGLSFFQSSDSGVFELPDAAAAAFDAGSAELCADLVAWLTRADGITINQVMPPAACFPHVV